MINKDFFSIKVDKSPEPWGDDEKHHPKPTVFSLKTNKEMNANDRYVEMLEQIAIAAWYYIRDPKNLIKVNELLRAIARWDNVYGWDGKWQNTDSAPRTNKKYKPAPKGKRRLTKK